MHESNHRADPGDVPACSLQLTGSIASEQAGEYVFHLAGANVFGNDGCHLDENRFSIGNRHPAFH